MGFRFVPGVPAGSVAYTQSHDGNSYSGVPDWQSRSSPSPESWSPVSRASYSPTSPIHSYAPFLLSGTGYDQNSGLWGLPTRAKPIAISCPNTSAASIRGEFDVATPGSPLPGRDGFTGYLSPVTSPSRSSSFESSRAVKNWRSRLGQGGYMSSESGPSILTCSKSEAVVPETVDISSLGGPPVRKAPEPPTQSHLYDGRSGKSFTERSDHPRPDYPGSAILPDMILYDNYTWPDLETTPSWIKKRDAKSSRGTGSMMERISSAITGLHSLYEQAKPWPLHLKRGDRFSSRVSAC